jgi:transcriptional regulator with XRE-family HTH domain
MTEQLFADQVRRAVVTALKLRKLSRYRLAKQLGCSQGSLGDFVNGRTWVGEEMLNKIARALGLRVERPKRRS